MNMAKLEMVRDTIELAKELSFEIEIQDQAHDEDLIMSALKILNDHHQKHRIGGREMIKAASLFVIPDHDADIERMTDEEIERRKVNNPIVQGSITEFTWFSSVSFTGIGLRLYGVDFVAPRMHHTQTAFVPVLFVDLLLSA